MRGLTLYQPMAWAIAEGHKPVENRPWPLPKAMIGQRFAVHAGKVYDQEWADMIRETFGLDVPTKIEIALGAIVAVATFVGYIDDRTGLVSMDHDQIDAVRKWFSGPYGFLVRDVQKLVTPIPCRGFQGLWTVPEDVERALCDQLQSPMSTQSKPTRTPSSRAAEVRSDQLTLVDPVALERERCLDIIRARSASWRSNATAGSNLVASALDHVAEEIQRG